MNRLDLMKMMMGQSKKNISLIRFIWALIAQKKQRSKTMMKHILLLTLLCCATLHGAEEKSTIKFVSFDGHQVEMPLGLIVKRLPDAFRSMSDYKTGVYKTSYELPVLQLFQKTLNLISSLSERDLDISYDPTYVAKDPEGREFRKLLEKFNYELSNSSIKDNPQLLAEMLSLSEKFLPPLIQKALASRLSDLKADVSNTDLSDHNKLRVGNPKYSGLVNKSKHAYALVDRAGDSSSKYFDSLKTGAQAAELSKMPDIATYSLGLISLAGTLRGPYINTDRDIAVNLIKNNEIIKQLGTIALRRDNLTFKTSARLFLDVVDILKKELNLSDTHLAGKLAAALSTKFKDYESLYRDLVASPDVLNILDHPMYYYDISQLKKGQLSFTKKDPDGIFFVLMNGKKMGYILSPKERFRARYMPQKDILRRYNPPKSKIGYVISDKENPDIIKFSYFDDDKVHEDDLWIKLDRTFSDTPDTLEIYDSLEKLKTRKIN